jgi:hypothetical protein
MVLSTNSHVGPCQDHLTQVIPSHGVAEKRAEQYAVQRARLGEGCLLVFLRNYSFTVSFLPIGTYQVTKDPTISNTL